MSREKGSHIVEFMRSVSRGMGSIIFICYDNVASSYSLETAWRLQKGIIIIFPFSLYTLHTVTTRIQKVAHSAINIARELAA